MYVCVFVCLGKPCCVSCAHIAHTIAAASDYIFNTICLNHIIINYINDRLKYLSVMTVVSVCWCVSAVSVRVSYKRDERKN